MDGLIHSSILCTLGRLPSKISNTYKKKNSSIINYAANLNLFSIQSFKFLSLSLSLFLVL